ncbi:MAG: SagB/ThcOx family dehydrogenase [Candidatus Neomarinimicrobiota bacterium]
MKKLLAFLLIGVIMISFFSPKKLRAQDAVQKIELPAVQKTGGMPLMEALNNRHSSRSFEKTNLSEQDLSNLLWAAWGYNRPDKGKRTAPSSMNKQEITVYCAMEKGLYLYNAKEHVLELVLDEDIRAKTGSQLFVGSAPLNLVYVADTKKQTSEKSSASNVGFISQNVYLFCASEGLNTVVRGWFDSNKLHKAMKLKKQQSIILCQTVGYSKK